MQDELTIVYPPVIDYKFLYQRPQQLMKAFAELGVNTIFINPAHVFPQEQAVWTPFAHLPNFKVIRADTDIRPHIKGKLVLWLSYGQHLYLVDQLKPDVVVYDSIDKASDEFAHWKKWIPQLESVADVVFATAKVMYIDHKQRHRNVHMLPNAADYEHFAAAQVRIGERPPEYPKVGPVVGYYGAMASWLDVDMVKAIADKYMVVMIGANQYYNVQVPHTNVRVLPMQPYEKLPYYLSWFDVAIIPFKLTDMIEGCDPIKVYEYLSAGKPVVASDMLELRKFGDLIYRATTDNAVQMVEKALRENDMRRIRARIEMARANSWRSRAEYALRVIRELV